MTEPLDQDDFTQEPVANTSKSSKVPSWVAGASGCGCLSFFIISLIGAISLPTFLTSSNKAKQSEARIYIGSMNKRQQAYRTEKPTFANSIRDLQVEVSPETKNYTYKIVPQYDKSKSVMMTAAAKTSGLKSYTGAVFAIKKGNEVTTVTVICESDAVSTAATLRATNTPPPMPATPKDELTPIECPAGSRSLTR